jgi:hypothetical protein
MYICIVNSGWGSGWLLRVSLTGNVGQCRVGLERVVVVFLIAACCFAYMSCSSWFTPVTNRFACFEQSLTLTMTGWMCACMYQWQVCACMLAVADLCMHPSVQQWVQHATAPRQHEAPLHVCTLHQQLIG